MIAQLELKLNDEVKAVPWEGRSPRSLTRVQIALSLQREREKKRERTRVDPFQLDFFRTPQLPRRYGGAPSLLPLPRRGF